MTRARGELIEDCDNIEDACSGMRGKTMLCCALLCGLVFLGPRGARLLRLLRRADAAQSTAQPPVEVARSAHLVLAPLGAGVRS
jgi:hypothetical protein